MEGVTIKARKRNKDSKYDKLQLYITDEKRNCNIRFWYGRFAKSIYYESDLISQAKKCNIAFMTNNREFLIENKNFDRYEGDLYTIIRYIISAATGEGLRIFIPPEELKETEDVYIWIKSMINNDMDIHCAAFMYDE